MNAFQQNGMEFSYPNYASELYNIKIEPLDPGENDILNVSDTEDIKQLEGASVKLNENELHHIIHEDDPNTVTEVEELNGYEVVFDIKIEDSESNRSDIANEIEEFGSESINAMEQFESEHCSSQTIKIEQIDAATDDDDISANIIETYIPNTEKTDKLGLSEDTAVNENLSEPEIEIEIDIIKEEEERDNIPIYNIPSFPCQLCSKVFKRKFDLKRHFSLHTGEKSYPCKFCVEVFSNGSQLSKHRAELHPEEKEWTCSACSETFENKQKLSFHMKKSHSINKPDSFQYEICIVDFKSQEELNEHDQFVHKRKDKITCLFCGKSFTYPSDLKRHERKHTGFRPYICSICSKSYSSANQLSKHVEIHKQRSAGEKWFKCNSCVKAFLSNIDLRRHIRRVHNPALPFTCQICKEKLPTLELHRKHKKEVHDIKLPPTKEKQLLECESCLKKFKYPSDLKRHLLTHTTESVYKCEKCLSWFKHAWTYDQHVRQGICDESKQIEKDLKKETKGQEEETCPYCLKLFKKSGLNFHIAIHHKDNYPCKKCGDVFANRELLLRHRESMHHKVWPCEHCDQVFKVKRMLENHIRTHTKEKPFQCHICAALFTQKAGLMAHILCHDEFRPKRSCPKCSKMFVRKHDLKRHLIKYHGLEKDKNDCAYNLECNNLEHIDETVAEMIDPGEANADETLNYYQENSKKD